MSKMSDKQELTDELVEALCEAALELGGTLEDFSRVEFDTSGDWVDKKLEAWKKQRVNKPK